VLSGGNGNDVLNGGTGADIMAGGAGNDTYVWNSPAERTDNLTDFKVLGTDVLQFKAAAFGFAPGHVLINGTEFIANTAPGSNHAGPTFLMETKFTTFISTPMGMEQEPPSGSPT
jgi:Ca2+-binding RTX toxin-like protein